MNARFIAPPPLCRVIPLKLTCLAILSVFCALAVTAQTQPKSAAKITPVSLPHLYWHFLIQQNALDTAAAKLQSEGKSGTALRNDLQNRLGFSDADFVPIRTSSQRLAAELKPINAQLKALPRTEASASQARTLISQRESYINNEVYNLSLELPPQNKVALEKFMTQFFAPKPLTVPGPPANQPAGKAVAR